MTIYNNYESCLQWLALRLWRLTPLSIEKNSAISWRSCIIARGNRSILEKTSDIVSFTVILSITTAVVVYNSPVIDIVSFIVILSITTGVVVYNSPVIDIVSFIEVLQ
jgi:hypothetical protein